MFLSTFLPIQNLLNNFRPCFSSLVDEGTRLFTENPCFR